MSRFEIHSQEFAPPSLSVALRIGVRCQLLERGDSTLGRHWLAALRVPLWYSYPPSEITRWIEYHHQFLGSEK